MVLPSWGAGIAGDCGSSFSLVHDGAFGNFCVDLLTASSVI